MYTTETVKTLISNKKIRKDYEIRETYSAGIELFGFEVKSLKNGRGSLDGSHVVIRGGEAFLINAHIPPYQAANTPPSYDERRTRKLLLHKREIFKLEQEENKKGLTIVPISVYNNGSHIKVEVALVQGKKKYDKREVIKARDTKRDLDRTLKRM